MNNFENILVDRKEAIAYITINREAKLNALNKLTLEELSTALDQLKLDHSVRGLVITGAGSKAFVAGADISEFSSFNIDQGKALAIRGQHTVFDKIESFPKPVLAAINGFALGGGLELAMACHMRIAVTTAKMGLPEVTLGLIPGYGGTQRLPQLVGKGRAIEMITTAQMVSATDALTWGLVNYVVDAEMLMPKAEEIMALIQQRAPLAVEAALKSIHASTGPEGYAVEIEAFAACFATQDFKEGVDAFLNKRKAAFLGR